MRLKNILKSISKVMLGVTLAITFLLFICPMGAIGSTGMGTVGVSAGCHDGALTNGMAHSAKAFNTCLDFHLGAVNQFTENLFTPGEMSLASMLAMVILISYGLFVALDKTIVRELLRFKHRYRLYIQSIRLLCRQKLMAWLSLLVQNESAS